MILLRLTTGFFLAACIGSAASMASAQDQAARHANALAIFDAACLQTLPGFADAGDKLAEAGFQHNTSGYWVDDPHGMIAQISQDDNDRQRGCFVAMSDADIAAFDAVLGQSIGGALGLEQVGIIDGPSATDPSLYVVDRDGYRLTAVAAHISKGYGMLSVSVTATDDGTPPWATE